MANSEKTQRKKRTLSPASLANLKPFKKGESGNPAGPAPGYKHRGAIYERILNLKTEVDLPNGEKEELTVYEATALGQTMSAMGGNTAAWKEIQDSLHGKMTEKAEIKVTAEELAQTVIQTLVNDHGWTPEKANAYIRQKYPETQPVIH